MATFRSNSYQGRQLRLEVTQNGGYANWTLYSEGGSVNYYTIYNLSIKINGTNVYSPGTVSASSQAFPAAKGSKGGSVWIGNGASSKTITVSFIGAVYYNRSTENGGSFTMGAYIHKPSLSALTISNISDKSAAISFTVTNNNGQAPTDSYIDIFSDSDLKNKVKTISSKSGTFTGLDPNRTYWARGNAANSAGRTYTATKSFTTTFINPGAPNNLKVTYDKSEPIPTANYTLSWSAASAGSTAVAGYRIKVLKNNEQVLSIDTENTDTAYTISAEELDFQVGDVLQFGIYAYSKDWNNGKHLTGDGAIASEVKSGTIVIVSDKYIYVSQNGSTFTKYKMYISIDGASFKEVKKEKFRIIQ